MKMQKLEPMQGQLNMAKNYLEQQIELSIGKRSVVFGYMYGMVIFHNGEQVVAAAKDRMLHIFHEQVELADFQFLTRCNAVDLNAIKSANALFCKRCRRWLTFHPILKRCSCGTYLKARKRFYIDGKEIEEDLELLESTVAKHDMYEQTILELAKSNRDVRKMPKQMACKVSRVRSVINAWKVRAKIKRYKSIPVSYVARSKTVNNYCIERRSYTWFLEKAVIKVNGKAVPEEAKIPLLLSMNIF